MTPEFLNAIAALLAGIAWPVILLVIILIYRRPITDLLDRIISITFVGLKAELNKKVDEKSKSILDEADPEDAVRESTPQQIEAAEQVEQIVKLGDRSAAREQMRSLADRYELLRAALPSGTERTQQLDALVLQMKIMALACWPYLQEFANGRSPGERLAAVAMLQIRPERSYCDWLAQRFKEESAFISYHAALALRNATRVVKQEDRLVLEKIILAAKTAVGQELQHADTQSVLDDALRVLIGDKETRHWVIAPCAAESPDVWEQVWEFDLKNNVISIGWNELNDISSLDERGLRAAIDRTYPDITKKGKNSYFWMLWKFYHSIKPGDIVIARRGVRRIAAVGTVLRKAYYDPDNTAQGPNEQPKVNHLPVQWHTHPRDKEFSNPVFGMQTVTEVPKEKFLKLVENCS